MKQLELYLSVQTRTVAAHGKLRVTYVQDRDEEHVDALIERMTAAGLVVQKGETEDFEYSRAAAPAREGRPQPFAEKEVEKE